MTYFGMDTILQLKNSFIKEFNLLSKQMVHVSSKLWTSPAIQCFLIEYLIKNRYDVN